MEKIHPSSALYIKLGKGGEHEKECLKSPGYLWAGWDAIGHDICLKGKWDKAAQLGFKTYYKSMGAAANQANQLKYFYTSSKDVLWITFHDQKLWWCFAEKEVIPLTEMKGRIRNTLQGWYDCDIQGNELLMNRLSGSLLSVGAFRGAICRVKEFDYVVRKINCETSLAEDKVSAAQNVLIESLIPMIKDLHWKEFEVLTDLIFRQAGWQRLAVLGKTTKDIDLDLLSPIDQRHYRVQVKSSAGQEEFDKFAQLAEKDIDEEDNSMYFFFVHTPEKGYIEKSDNHFVKLLLVEDVARLVVNYGLVDWLIAKAK